MTPFARRRIAATTALTLITALLSASPALAAPTAMSPRTGSPQATSAGSPAALAAGYLARELDAGKGVLSVTSDGTTYPDYGITADAVLALDAAGVASGQAAASTSLLADHAADYIGFGDPKAASAGSVAKLLNVALAQGVDPSDFGGYDLVSTLRSLESPKGRFRDRGAKDYSNTFGQALAIIGLSRSEATPSAAAVDFLESQQCPDGGFRVDPGAKDCTSDPDATAMAVQAVVAVDGGPGEVADAALDYLGLAQQPDGGVKGAGTTPEVNANTTALAGQAFAVGGRDDEAAATTRYLTGLQYGCDLPAGLRGGVAYDAAALAKREGAGAKATPSDQDRRSTTQAVLALAGVPLLSVTSEGAGSGLPEMACDAASSSAGAPGTATAAGAESSSGSSAPGVDGPIGLAVLLAVVLLAGGAAYLLFVRRKGERT